MVSGIGDQSTRCDSACQGTVDGVNSGDTHFACVKADRNPPEEGCPSVNGQSSRKHWWASNLEGARTTPVKLPSRDVPMVNAVDANSTVYAAHVWGPSIHTMDYFYDGTYPAKCASVGRRTVPAAS